MNPTAFTQVEQLYHTLLPLPPAERAAQLAAVSDAEVRAEIERLLQANEQAGDFLNTPAAAAWQDTAPLPQPRTMGHYRLQRLLGKGGMGEVYLAADTLLERQVALKLLPAAFTDDSERIRRFTREAKAASALNHPNILTIYEIGQEADTHYIATEFIAGETLRQRLQTTRLPLRTVLDIAVQTASALVAAHEAGIVHRDIKPENVMLRSDGLVKVLDFGLAKLAERKSEGGKERGRDREKERRGEDDPTLALSPRPAVAPSLTDPGTVMGTASYMSPEQARGQEVDARSDIFSLGVMLYEMLAGRVPFAGVNPIDVLGAILNQETAPLRQFVPDLPSELQRIVNKALRKDRDERYQHSKELWLDLNDLRRELEFEEKLKARQLSTNDTGESAPPALTAETFDMQSTVSATTQPTVSSAKIILSELKRHKTGAMLGLGAVVLLLVSAVFGVYKMLGSGTTKPTTAPQALKFMRLTAHGQAVAAAISPDGKYVVYAKQEPAGQSLWLRQIALNNSDVQIAPPQETVYRSFTYSRDGNFIYYVEGRLAEPAALYRMSALGRNPTKLLTDRNFFYVTFSPDGQRLAYLRPYPGRANELVVASADGKDARVLATGGTTGDLFHAIAWSPDGKTIAENIITRDTEGRYETVVALNVESGAMRPLTSQRWVSIGQVQWLPDGSGLMILASQTVGSSGPTFTANRQLWQLSLPGGEAHRITNDLNSYYSLSLTADAGSLIALQGEDSLSLWVAPAGDAGRAKQLPRIGKNDGGGGIAWTPDGRLVYTSTAGGSIGLWLTNADGGSQKQLEVGEGRQPTVSADGRWLAFERTGHFSIWLMELGSGGVKKLSTGSSIVLNPSLTPDGKWVVYTNNLDDKASLWKAPLEGGAPVRLTEQYARLPALSPDGKLIAYLARDAQQRTSLAVMPFEGGPPSKSFDLPPTLYYQAGLRWTPDGRSITYISTINGVSNIWGQPLDGSTPKQLTNFQSEQIRAFAWSKDGQLAVSRGVVTSDVVLITDFK